MSWSTVLTHCVTARRGEMRSTAIVSRPDTSSSVPAVDSQLSLKVVVETASPSALRTSSPGHANSFVRPSRNSLNGSHVICASAKTTMMIRYGA